MAGAVPHGTEQGLAWLLSGLAERVPHVRGVVLFTGDGLLKDHHGVDRADAEHLSAIGSGLFSLARGTGQKFGTSDGVRHVAVELEDLMLFVVAAGSGSGLVALAGRAVDVAVLGYQMTQLVRSVQPYLGTAVRSQPR